MQGDWCIPAPVRNQKEGFHIYVANTPEGRCLVQGDHVQNKLDGVCWVTPLPKESSAEVVERGSAPQGKHYFGVYQGNKRAAVGQMWTEGKIYTGEFLDNHRQGLGLQEHKRTGECYLGHFVTGVMEGFGVWRYGEEERIGTWKGGLLHGRAIEVVKAATEQSVGSASKGGLSSQNLERYVGSFEKGRRHGAGCLTIERNGYFSGQASSPKGTGLVSYIGGWKDGLKAGFGVLVEGNREYLGSFSQGKPTGIGQLSFLDSSEIYLGEFTDGKMEGFGRLVDGKHYNYMGYWNNDLKDGIGYEKQNDEVYIGEWRQNKKNGIGYLITRDIEYKGEFLDGLMHGVGIIKRAEEEKIVRAARGHHAPESQNPHTVKHVLEFFESLSPESFFTASRTRITGFTQEIKDVAQITQNLQNSCLFDFEEEYRELKHAFSGVKNKLAKLESSWRVKRDSLVQNYSEIPHHISCFLRVNCPTLAPIDSLKLFSDLPDPKTHSLFSGRTRNALLDQVRDSTDQVERISFTPSRPRIDQDNYERFSDQKTRNPQDREQVFRTEPKLQGQAANMRSPSRSSEWRVSLQFDPQFSQCRDPTYDDESFKHGSSLRIPDSDSYHLPKWRELNTKSEQKLAIEGFSSFKDRSHNHKEAPVLQQVYQPDQAARHFDGRVPALEMQRLNRVPMFNDSSSSDNHMLSFRDELSSIKYYHHQTTSHAQSPERKQSPRASKEDLMTMYSHLEDFMELPSVRSVQSSQSIGDRIPQEFNSFNKPLEVPAEDSPHRGDLPETDLGPIPKLVSFAEVLVLDATPPAQPQQQGSVLGESQDTANWHPTPSNVKAPLGFHLSSTGCQAPSPLPSQDRPSPIQERFHGF